MAALTGPEAILNDIAQALSTMKVNIPEQSADGGKTVIKKFELTEADIPIRARVNPNGARDYTPPGMYTGLFISDKLWMSDTLAERFDHLYFINKVIAEGSERILITGLGLGMVIEGLVRLAPCVKQITVIEDDFWVFKMVGAYYADILREKGIDFNFVHADAWDWFKSQSYRMPFIDAAWHDIWISQGNHLITEYAEMKDSYANLVVPGGFQMCWGEQCLEDCESHDLMLKTMHQIMKSNVVIDEG
ncbi:hypothetical protein GMA3_83 [Gordonia phage GMA3]|uniref:Methyltransferase n=1 Tax=Gordonia phage GMA3 TaxID=1647284 RepID=A0A0K0NKM4_9CAUD|nr:methyltransferase [Gordonia phage GMA3]AKL88260.1 hypothetical protein GMA3_83 [Gordonia phage GMA3]